MTAAEAIKIIKRVSGGIFSDPPHPAYEDIVDLPFTDEEDNQKHYSGDNLGLETKRYLTGQQPQYKRHLSVESGKETKQLPTPFRRPVYQAEVINLDTGGQRIERVSHLEVEGTYPSEEFTTTKDYKSRLQRSRRGTVSNNFLRAVSGGLRRIGQERRLPIESY